MGDIKITDVKKQFRAIAENANKVENGGNGNEYLDGKEISVFKQYAKFAGATEKDFEKMGLTVEKTEEEKETAVVTNPQNEQKAANRSKYEQQSIDKRVKQAVKELVRKGTSREGFIDALAFKFAKVNDGKVVRDENTGKPVVQEAFAQSINEIKAVINSVDIDKVTTKKDVKEVAKQAKKAFPKPTEAQEVIIDKMEDWAEASAISKRLDTLRRMYSAKLDGGHNFQITLDALKKDLKTKKDGQKEWDKDYTSYAFDILEKDAKGMALDYTRANLHTTKADVLDEKAYVNEQLQKGKITKEEAEKALARLDEDEKLAIDIEKAESKSKVRKALKAANKDDDKFLEDAYERRLAGKRSKTVKHDMEETARENKSNHKVEATMVDVKDPKIGETTRVSQMSKEDITADLKSRVNGNTFWRGVRQYTLISSFGNLSSKDAEKLVSKLKGNSNYYNSETNTFDLAAIKKDVVEDIGDLILNLEDDKNSSEIENLKQHMNARMGLTGKDKITTSEARALVKLIEGDIEHPDLREAGAVGAVATLGAALAGLVGGFVAIHGKLEINQTVKLNFADKAVFEDFTKQLDSMGINYTTTDLSGGKKGITIFQQILKSDENAINTLFGLINGLGIGAATGILTALIVGQQNSEYTCMPVGDYNIHNTRYTDAEQYKEYISNRYSSNPIKVRALKMMVDKYVDFYGKEDWHVEYQNDLRLAAGLGSTMNPNECMKFFSQKKYERHTNNNETKQPENTQPENTQEQDKVKIVPRCSQNVATSKPVVVERLKKQEDWGVMAEKYDCLKKDHPEIFNSYKVKTRYMKAIQAIKDNDYRLTNIKKYADISLGVKLKGKGHEREDVQNLRMAFQKAIAEGKVNPDDFNIETFIKLIVYPQVQAQKIPTIIDDTKDNVTCEYNKTKKIVFVKRSSWTKGTPTAPEGDVSIQRSSIPGSADVVDKNNNVLKTESTVEKAKRWADENKLVVANPDVKDC